MKELAIALLTWVIICTISLHIVILVVEFVEIIRWRMRRK